MLGLVFGSGWNWIVVGAITGFLAPPGDCPCECGPAPPAAPAPGASRCRVRLTGVGVSTARGLSVAVGTDRYAAEGLFVDVALPEGGATATIDDERFTGSQKLTRTACATGPVDLAVHPRPARVAFALVPEDVAVICHAGCREAELHQPRTLATFPAIDIDAGTLQRTIEIEFKHPDYRPKTLSAEVVPGPNLVEVALQPRCSGL